MENINKLVTSLLLLIIIFAGIGWILSAQAEKETLIQKSELNSEYTILTFVGTGTVKSSGTVLVTDRYVNKLDVDAQVITIGSDGAMYNVQNGVVLADNMIIKKDQEESSNVRLHQLRNSATQNSFN